MFYAVAEQERKSAKSPHELAMVNLLLFNLLAGVALLAGSMAEPDSLIAEYRWLVVSVPLLLSLAVIGFTWVRAAKASGAGTWFVAVHWRLAARRYRVLLLAYLVSAAVVSIGFFGSGDREALERRIAELPPALQEMERHKLESQDMGTAIWARIGVVPLVLTVMALLMLESGALYQAGRGELPNGMAAAFPPPQDLPASTLPIPGDSGPSGE
jgi:hypothetical protein